MASPQAIMRAARAVPGGARPTAPPQGDGAGPYFGRISPLAAQLTNENSYASAYGPFLPRPAATFTQGAFGPFSPILPVPVDDAPPGGVLPDPRRFEYPVGWNLPAIPGQDGFKLASFATLRTLADTYSVARTCIERRKYDIAGLDWDIVPTREASKAYQGDHAAMRDFGERRARAVKFFRQPDPNYFSFSSWLKAALEEVFVYDALSLVVRPKRGRGLGKGVLGSDLDCLELIDGATVRPLLNLAGGVPRPPAPAYQQFIYGVPRCDLQAMIGDRDLDAAGLAGEKPGLFTADQLLYLPITPRPFSPYGFGPTEQALIVIMTGLQKQGYQLDYYREGSVPAVYISPGDANITPNQVRELQDALNGFAGDPAWHHKIIVLPPGAKVMPQKAQDLADQFDEIIMTEVCMTYDVDPMSLGIIPKVSTVASPFAAKEMAQASRTVHDRTSTRPLLKYLCDIFNAVLHRVCGQHDMRFTFAGMDEAADQAAVTDLLVKQFQNGFISIDEARDELQRTPWGLPETSGPLFATQMGPVPLNEAVAAAQQRLQAPAGGGAQAAAEPGSRQPRAVHHPPSSRPVGTHNPRQGLPAGAGMRTGLPSGASAADTPAHTAARAHQDAGGGPAKAVRAELDALARHLRKGRDIATWQARHLPGVAMAIVAEDLTKGIGIDEAVRGAERVALPGQAHEWADEAVAKAAPQWPGWQRDRQLQQAYSRRILSAFRSVTRKAVRLVRRWLSGALAVTAAVLAAMIGKLVRKALKPVLEALWREAWHLGRRSAAAVLARADPDWHGWEPGSPQAAGDVEGLQGWLASHGREWLDRISATDAGALEAALRAAAAAGDAEAAAEAAAQILQAAMRAPMIAETELGRAQAAAAMAAYREAGTALKEWLCEPGACPRCLANQDQGPLPLDAVFASGDVTVPAHPRCRCAVLGVTGAAKAAAGLSGQQYWPAGSYPHGPAMGGGGMQHAAHGPDGIQEYVPGGVPGMTAGAEPPRWDGGDVPPVTEGAGDGGGRAGGSRGGGTAGGPYRDGSRETRAHYPEGGEDAAWPGERGVPPRPGADWPAPYMDGYWPAGGHGSGQAPGMSVGGGERGRPPSPAGKSAMPVPVADAERVHAVMRGNFPAAAISWVLRADWAGPCEVPWEDINSEEEASWAASHEPAAVERFMREIAAGADVPPSVLVLAPGARRYVIVDGHHRALARHRLGLPVLAWAGRIRAADEEAALETHSSQFWPGADPRNKAAAPAREDPSRVAFVLIRARNEDGKWRYLLQKRDDGTWGLPGGKTHEGELPWDAAVREAGEEMGELPRLRAQASWSRPGDGHVVYTFLVSLPGLFTPSADGETGDETHGWGWFRRREVGDLPLHPAMRETWEGLDFGEPLLGGDGGAVKSARTPAVSTVHHRLGTEGLWHTPSGKVPELQQLPAYVQNTARALMRDEGMGESRAIATAVNAIKEWAQGRAFGGKVKVTPQVQEAARRAVAEWEKLRAAHAG